MAYLGAFFYQRAGFGGSHLLTVSQALHRLIIQGSINSLDGLVIRRARS